MRKTAIYIMLIIMMLYCFPCSVQGEEAKADSVYPLADAKTKKKTLSVLTGVKEIPSFEDFAISGINKVGFNAQGDILVIFRPGKCRFQLAVFNATGEYKHGFELLVSNQWLPYEFFFYNDGTIMVWPGKTSYGRIGFSPGQIDAADHPVYQTRIVSEKAAATGAQPYMLISASDARLVVQRADGEQMTVFDNSEAYKEHLLQKERAKAEEQWLIVGCLTLLGAMIIGVCKNKAGRAASATLDVY